MPKMVDNPFRVAMVRAEQEGLIDRQGVLIECVTNCVRPLSQIRTRARDCEKPDHVT